VLGRNRGKLWVMLSRGVAMGEWTWGGRKKDRHRVAGRKFKARQNSSEKKDTAMK